jgi:hypothetical protein
MKLRFAKKSDIALLAKIHLDCGRIQPDGFMHQLGLPFLKTYYRILLNEKESIVLVAENEDGFMLGFCSGSLSAEEHLKELKRKKMQLAFSSIPALLKSPNIFKKLVARDKYVNSAGQSVNFGISKGTRFEYWAWHPENKNAGMAISIMKVWLQIVFKLGATSIKAEVDKRNKDILQIHKLLGAKIIQEFNLPDGRNRVFIEYTKI